LPKVVEPLDSLVRKEELELELEMGSMLEVVGSRVTPVTAVHLSKRTRRKPMLRGDPKKTRKTMTFPTRTRVLLSSSAHANVDLQLTLSKRLYHSLDVEADVLTKPEQMSDS